MQKCHNKRDTQLSRIMHGWENSQKSDKVGGDGVPDLTSKVQDGECKGNYKH